MEEIRLITLIYAPRERVFDLSRSVDAHLASAVDTGERAIAGATTGLLELNDEITWEARHYGVRLKLTVRVTEFDRPRYFKDIMISGYFKHMVHDHNFEVDGRRTVMYDCFKFSSPLGVVGKACDKLFLKSYMRRFLLRRNEVLKDMAEGFDWINYIRSPL